MVHSDELLHFAQLLEGDTVFFDVYSRLCKEIGKTPTSAALDMGIARSTVSAWKSEGRIPSGATLQKVADYFGVSTDYLLEKENDPAANGEVTDDDIKFALFGGAPVTDEQYEEVKRFARYVRDRDIHSK